MTPYGTFRAADQSINVAVGTEAQWSALCEILGMPGLTQRREYSQPALRAANREALSAELNDLFGKKTAAEWLTRLRAAGVPSGPIYTMDQVFRDPQIQALGLVQTVRNGPDEDRLLRGPLWIDGQSSPVRKPPPALGQHSREILGELGYDNPAIDEMLARGVVRQAGAHDTTTLR